MDGSLQVISGSAFRPVEKMAPPGFPEGPFSIVKGRIHGHCPHCTRFQPLTKDHIIPYRCIKRQKPCRRVKPFPAEGVNNIRWVCAQCNLLRGVAADCPVILVSALAVARDVGWDVKTILRIWGFLAPKRLRVLAIPEKDLAVLAKLRREVYALVESIRKRSIEMVLTK